MADRRILVVDDEPNVVSSITEKLEREGFHARGVTDGAQAVDVYKSEGFDLVLTDLKMPGTDGMEVLKAIMEHEPDALVVMITGFGTVDTAVEALRLGAMDFITKPFQLDALVIKLRSVLEQRGDRAVRGNLRDLGLASIISVNCNEHNQAQLLIRRQGRLGKIYFDGGTIVHAALDDEEGEGVIYELLAWEDGNFSLEQGVPAPKHTIGTEWTGLVLEGLRRIDEGTSDSELAWEDGETQPEENMDRVARALEALDGITGVVVCSQGGELLGQAKWGGAVGKAVLTAFVGRRAQVLGALVNADELRQVVATAGGRGTMIVPHGRNYVALSLVERASAESVAQNVATILRRYQ